MFSVRAAYVTAFFVIVFNSDIRKTALTVFVIRAVFQVKECWFIFPRYLNNAGMLSDYFSDPCSFHIAVERKIRVFYRFFVCFAADAVFGLHRVSNTVAYKTKRMTEAAEAKLHTVEEAQVAPNR